MEAHLVSPPQSNNQGPTNNSTSREQVYSGSPGRPGLSGRSGHRKCSICYTNNVDCSLVFCEHSLCRECVDKWIRECPPDHPTCPYCRGTIFGIKDTTSGQIQMLLDQDATNDMESSEDSDRYAGIN